MLVAVLMVFVIFSFTGVAVMNVSYLSASAAMETINNIKLQYAVESSVNETLWRINAGADSLVNSDADGITTVWDSSSQVLSVSVDKFQMESEILLDLSEDTHFDRGIAAEEDVILDGNDPGLSEEHQVRSDFKFLPDVDLQYFYDNAVEIHTNSGWWLNYDKFEDVTFADGIHIFEGNYLIMKNIKINSGTLIFTGHHVLFWNDNEITAPPADSSGALPALVFTNPYQNFELQSPDGGETILGAIYCTRTIYLRNGTVSGPIIGKVVSMSDDFDFLDSEYNDYYQWTRGFGERRHYDWPKQIGRWRVHKWIKKMLS